MNTRILLPPISPAAGKPLYEQIIDGVKREISAGRMKPGTQLPSFRELAEQLLVSVITVKRSYEDLERQGIIYRKQGLGTFVAEQALTRNLEVRSQKVEELLRQALREGIEAGLRQDVLLGMAKRILRESGEG